MLISFSKNYHKGFTLIEVMVSVSIFALVMTVGIGALLTVNQAHRLSQSKRAAVDNINYVMEMMSREIRTGHDYSQAVNASSFDFTDQDGVDIKYYLAIGSNGTTPLAKETTGPLGFQSSLITDPDTVVIDSLSFNVVGASSADTVQPYVTINIEFHPAQASTQQVSSAHLYAQTSISQRLLDVAPVSPLAP